MFVNIKNPGALTRTGAYADRLNESRLALKSCKERERETEREREQDLRHHVIGHVRAPLKVLPDGSLAAGSSPTTGTRFVLEAVVG